VTLIFLGEPALGAGYRADARMDGEERVVPKRFAEEVLAGGGGNAPACLSVSLRDLERAGLWSPPRRKKRAAAAVRTARSTVHEACAFR